MILGSVVTSIISPFAKLFGWLLAAFYSISGNYGIAIILLTLVTMIAVFPLTRKGTRSMMQMQLLQPELMQLRNKYKRKPNMTSEERREVAQQQQEEMMALYRENGVSPTGGCLPMFLQFPVFIVLYNTIRGMTRTVSVGKGKAAHVVLSPEYISTNTRLYRSLVDAKGKMEAFGLNLADSVRTHQTHWTAVIPYVVVILVAVALQYVSIWQITNRNPTAGAANQQMQQIQKLMPLIFIFIYIEFPAGVGLYFIVSSAFRIGQQEWMYKRDPHILESIQKLKEMKAKNPPAPTVKPKGFRERLAALAPQADPSLQPSSQATRKPASSARRPGARPSGTKPPGSRPSPSGTGGKPRPSQGASRPGQSRPGQGRPRPSAESGSGPSSDAGRPRQPRPAAAGGAQRPAGKQGPGAPRKPLPPGSTRPRPTGSGQRGPNGQTRRAPDGSRNGGTTSNGSESSSNNGSADTSSTPREGQPRRRGRPR